MRNYLSYTAIGVALAAGTSLAHAQTVETVIPQPVPLVVAQQPVVAVPAPVAAAPVETIETVRTVRTTTIPARRVVRHVHRRVTTTRTIVSERIAPAPGLYDVATPEALPPVAGGFVAAPAVGAVVPAYRYVYEPDRILVIDPYTNVAVRAIPR